MENLGVMEGEKINTFTFLAIQLFSIVIFSFFPAECLEQILADVPEEKL